MNRSISRLNAALAVLCTALLTLLVAAPAIAAAIHFERESLKAYEAQLHKGEVHALTFHPPSGGSTVGHLHISLNNGEHMSVTYVASGQGKLVAQAQAANARVKVAAATTKKKAAPVKHKLRYIAGGILIVVIVVVLIVLLVGRRRAVAGEGGHAPGGEGAA
jgi:magnesium-transporting ATPase (P-type)